MECPLGSGLLDGMVLGGSRLDRVVLGGSKRVLNVGSGLVSISYSYLIWNGLSFLNREYTLLDKCYEGGSGFIYTFSNSYLDCLSDTPSVREGDTL